MGKHYPALADPHAYAEPDTIAIFIGYSRFARSFAGFDFRFSVVVARAFAFALTHGIVGAS